MNYTLSNRMAAVADLVPKGSAVCDIGCDHGFIAIYLAEKGICPKVIAMDVNKGPLFRAREHIESAGLSSYIETRLSDGLEKLEPGEADCMIAAGMGGRLTVKILSDYPEKRKSLRFLVLQPQSETAFVRRFLRENGFAIRREDMAFEDGKFYPMMFAEAVSPGGGGESICGKDGRTPEAVDIVSGAGELRYERGAILRGQEAAYLESLEDEFGPCLMRDRHPVLFQYLDWWEGQQNKILSQVSGYRERRGQVEMELLRIRDARGLMEKREEYI